MKFRLPRQEKKPKTVERRLEDLENQYSNKYGEQLASGELGEDEIKVINQEKEGKRLRIISKYSNNKNDTSMGD